MGADEEMGDVRWVLANHTYDQRTHSLEFAFLDTQLVYLAPWEVRECLTVLSAQTEVCTSPNRALTSLSPRQRRVSVEVSSGTCRAGGR